MISELAGIHDILRRISETGSLKEKESILKASAHNKCLARVLDLAMNPFKRYKLTSVDQSDGPVPAIDEVYDAFERMAASRTRVPDAVEVLSRAAQDPRDAVLINNILCKDLRCGMGIQTARKAFPEIPLHEVMRCKADLKKTAKKGPLVWSVKKDGVRTWAVVNVKDETVEYYSRSGHVFNNFHRLNTELISAAKHIRPDGQVIFDGEVVSLDEDFQSQMTQVNRLNDADPSVFRFWVFDIVMEGRLEERLELLDECFLPGFGLGNRVAYLVHHPFKVEDEETLLDEMVQAGEEGLVVKAINSQYEFKKSDSWCKIKRFYTVDIPVTGKKEGENKYIGTLGALVCDYNGVSVDVGSGFTDEERDQFWRNPPKLIECKYQEITKDKSLRFPVFIRVREDKTEPSDV